jgi:hypothetical protein
MLSVKNFKKIYTFRSLKIQEIKKGEAHQAIHRVLAIVKEIVYYICFVRQVETVICILKENCMFQRKKKADRRVPRQIFYIGHLPDPLLTPIYILRL